MKIRFITDSHTDHGLLASHWAFIQAEAAKLDGGPLFGTLRLPEHLPPVENALHGPSVGDAPVLEDEVVYERRGNRAWADRLVERPTRPTRDLTVIAFPVTEDEPDVLTMFTAYGGPMAPQHPEDPSNRDPKGAAAFWAEHALSR
jgi:hypothetical protein